MKVLLSHNMSGVPENEIYNLRAEAARNLAMKFDTNIEIIDNYNHHMSPDSMEQLSDYGKFVDNFLLPTQDYSNGKYTFNNPEFNTRNSLRLWHLGRSIQQLGQADAVYFIPGHSDSNGCKVERALCKIYSINVITLDDSEEGYSINREDIGKLSEDEILGMIEESLIEEAENISKAEYRNMVDKAMEEQRAKLTIPSFLSDYTKKDEDK